jgi:hypothetical protein
MSELDSIRKCIKDEIVRVKDNLIKSKRSSAVRFFLDSIQDDIRMMISEGFSYKQQVEIINRSSNKEIKYNTYIRYVKNSILGGSSNRGSQSRPKVQKHNNDDRQRFKHEAVPNVDELY